MGSGGIFLLLGGSAQALTADYVLNEMTPEQQHGYISGVVDGIAYARWLSDRPDETGMQCIYRWFYESGAEKWELVDSWFERHPEQPVDALLYVLIERECGE